MNAVLIDTGVILALLDRSEAHHRQCALLLDDIADPLVTCAAVIAESCHLLRNLLGAKEAILQNVEQGIFQIPFALANRSAEVRKLLTKYSDIPMDLADACLVDLATQTGTGRILTLDSDFKVYRWSRTRHFDFLLDVK